jgi:hypothetical protein
MASFRTLKDVALKIDVALEQLRDRVVNNYKKDEDYFYGGKEIYVTVDTALELKYHFLYE